MKWQRARFGDKTRVSGKCEMRSSTGARFHFQMWDLRVFGIWSFLVSCVALPCHNGSWCLNFPHSKCCGSHSWKGLCCSLVFTCPSCWLPGLLWNQLERSRLPRSRKPPRSWSETSPSRPLSGKSGNSSGRKVLCVVWESLWGGAAGIFIQGFSQIVNTVNFVLSVWKKTGIWGSLLRPVCPQHLCCGLSLVPSWKMGKIL